MITVVDLPNDESAAAAALTIGSTGAVDLLSPVAYSRGERQRVACSVLAVVLFRASCAGHRSRPPDPWVVPGTPDTPSLCHWRAGMVGGISGGGQGIVVWTRIG